LSKTTVKILKTHLYALIQIKEFIKQIYVAKMYSPNTIPQTTNLISKVLNIGTEQVMNMLVVGTTKWTALLTVIGKQLSLSPAVIKPCII